MDSKKSIVITQQNIKDQLDAVKLLADDFLSLAWPEKGAEPLTVMRSEHGADPALRTPFEQHCFAKRTRFERHCLALETAGALSPAAVLNLFEKLEQRAIYEINTLALLAQSHDPDGIASQRLNVPAIVLSNIHILHQYLPKAAQSKQNSDAASRPRPGRHHADRQGVENDLENHIKSDPNYPYAYAQKASFIREMLSKYPDVKSPNSIRDWMNEYLNKNLGRIAR